VEVQKRGNESENRKKGDIKRSKGTGEPDDLPKKRIRRAIEPAFRLQQRKNEKGEGATGG